MAIDHSRAMLRNGFEGEPGAGDKLTLALVTGMELKSLPDKEDEPIAGVIGTIGGIGSGAAHG